MANRLGALSSVFKTGKFGNISNGAGIHFSVDTDLSVFQIAAWPNTLNEVGRQIANQIGTADYAKSNQAVRNESIAMLRVEPLKWWVVGQAIDSFNPEQGSVLDISHARTHLKIGGPDAATLLNRFIPIDLRPQSFAVDQVASSAIHHIGVTLWRQEEYFSLFIPRGFAQSIYELLFESALQFSINCD